MLPTPFQVLKFFIFLTTDSSEPLPSLCASSDFLNWESLSWPSLRNFSRTDLNKVSTRGTILRKISNCASKSNGMQRIFASWRVFYQFCRLFKWNFQFFIYIRLIKSGRWSLNNSIWTNYNLTVHCAQVMKWQQIQ